LKTFRGERYNLVDAAKGKNDDEDEKDEDDDAEELLQRIEMSAVDGTRHSGHADATHVFEQFARDARHVLVVDEQHQVVDEPMAGRFVGHVIRGLVVGLLAELLRLKAAVLLQERRQARHRLHVLDSTFHLHSADHTTSSHASVCIIVHGEKRFNVFFFNFFAIIQRFRRFYSCHVFYIFNVFLKLFPKRFFYICGVYRGAAGKSCLDDQ